MVLINKDGFFDDLMSAFAAGDPDVGQKTREAEHVHCLHLMYHAIARGAFAEMLQLTTDDFSFEVIGPERSQLVGRWQGRQEVLAALTRNFAHFGEQQPHIETVVAQGDTVIVVGHEEGKILATGKPYHVQWVQIFTFVGNQVARARQIFDGIEKCGAANLP